MDFEGQNIDGEVLKLGFINLVGMERVTATIDTNSSSLTT